MSKVQCRLSASKQSRLGLSEVECCYFCKGELHTQDGRFAVLGDVTATKNKGLIMVAPKECGFNWCVPVGKCSESEGQY